MQDVDKKIQHLSQLVDIDKLSYREIGRRIARSDESPVHPQIIKNVLLKLRSEGLIAAPAATTTTTTTMPTRLVTIPILGMVNAGPATHIAGSVERGALRVSSSLLPSSNYKDFYALEVDGESMNRAVIRGNLIENGAYVIVDSSKKTPKDGDIVTVVHEGLANVKKVFFDYDNQVIVLRSESNQDFAPIVISPSDDWEGLIGGTIVHVVNKPKVNNLELRTVS